jgi:hypothetical protein
MCCPFHLKVLQRVCDSLRQCLTQWANRASSGALRPIALAGPESRALQSNFSGYQAYNNRPTILHCNRIEVTCSLKDRTIDCDHRHIKPSTQCSVVNSKSRHARLARRRVEASLSATGIDCGFANAAASVKPPRNVIGSKDSQSHFIGGASHTKPLSRI